MEIEARNSVGPIAEHVARRFAENRRRLAAAAEPGMQKVRDRFDVLIDLIRAGTSVRRACTELAFHREHLKRVLRDPERRARYDDAMAASIPLRKARLPEHMVKVWAGRLRRCEEIRAARPLRTGPKRHCSPRQHIPPAVLCDIIADVAAGTLLRDACSGRNIKVPAFQFRVLDDPALRPRWLWAKEAGSAARIAAGTLRHADAILSLVEAGSSVRAALAADPMFPHQATFRAALDTAPDMRWRYDRAVAGNKQARMVRKNQATLERLIASPAIVTSLSSDRLWRLALDALPRNLDHDTRNDVAAGIVAALLAGKLEIGEVKRQAHRFVTAHYKLFSTLQTRSLDAPIFSDSTVSLGDTITTGWND